MEAIKGVIYGKGQAEIDKSTKYRYLVGFMLVTDKRLTAVSETGETIIMGGQLFEAISQSLESIPKYKPPHPLGDLSSGIIRVCDMVPDDLEHRPGTRHLVEPSSGNVFKDIGCKNPKKKLAEAKKKLVEAKKKLAKARRKERGKVTKRR
jgi:hypothetical protein